MGRFDDLDNPARRVAPPVVGWKPSPDARRMTAEERTELRERMGFLRDMSAAERAEARRQKKPLHRCADCLHCTAGECRAKPIGRDGEKTNARTRYVKVHPETETACEDFVDVGRRKQTAIAAEERTAK